MEKQQPGIQEAIRFSWNKSKGILFPFQWKRWFRILIIAWLAGAGIQGINFRWSGSPKTETPAPTVPASKETSQKATPVQPSVAPLQEGASDIAGGSAVTTSQGQGSGQVKVPGNVSRPFPKPKVNRGAITALVIGVALLGLSFFIFFTWLSSRFHFILFDVIVKREAAIRGPFKTHKEIGNSLFKWSLGFLGISLGVILIILLVTGLLIAIAKGNIGVSFLVGVPAVLLLLGVIFLIVVIGIMINDFVTPIMYQKKISTADAFNKFLESDVFRLGAIIKYLLILLGLSILAGIVQMIVSVIVGLCGLIAGGILAIPGFFLIKALPLLKIPLIVLGVFLLIALAIAVVVIISLIMLPVVLFFRVFALAYLTRLYPDCDLLDFSREAETVSGPIGS